MKGLSPSKAREIKVKSKGGADITQKLIIGHRGAPEYAKENTIDSFEKAMILGADMIEFDVRRTRDHVLIVYHDGLIQERPIKDLTYEEVSQIGRNEGFDIPTVEEVLKWSSGKIKLDIELKEEGYEKGIVALLTRYFKKDQFIITSFNDSSLKIMKENDPDIRVGLLLGKSKGPFLSGISEFFPMKRCNKAKADFLAVHWKLLRFGFLDRAERNNKPVFVWTVNDEGMIWTLLHDRRIHAIVTDKPDLAVSLRKNYLRKIEKRTGFSP
jgi:glycerophosphoryl diester phosphodiesterase